MTVEQHRKADDLEAEIHELARHISNVKDARSRLNPESQQFEVENYIKALRRQNRKFKKGCMLAIAENENETYCKDDVKLNLRTDFMPLPQEDILDLYITKAEKYLQQLRETYAAL